MTIEMGARGGRYINRELSSEQNTIEMGMGAEWDVGIQSMPYALNTDISSYPFAYVICGTAHNLHDVFEFPNGPSSPNTKLAFHQYTTPIGSKRW